MKFIVKGYQEFDNYPDGTFDRKEFETKEEAEKYIENNRHKTGNVKGRHRVYRSYSIKKIKE